MYSTVYISEYGSNKPHETSVISPLTTPPALRSTWRDAILPSSKASRIAQPSQTRFRSDASVFYAFFGELDKNSMT